RLAVFDDALAIELDARQRASARTGREDHVLRLDRLAADVDAMRLPRARARQELRHAHDRIDPVLLEQEADALGDLVGDVARALDDRGKVRAHALDDHAELARAVRVLEDLGGLEKRLRRDAAPVEADAAEAFALDARGLEPELRCADRGDVASG